MATEITQDNFNEAVRKIERALVEFDNVTPFAGIKCDTCGREAALEDLEEFAKGAAYVPPDPFPLGTPVVDTRFPVASVVVRSEVTTPSDNHIHRRIVEIQPDGLTGLYYYFIDEEADGTDCLVHKKEWEVQQQGR